MKKQDTSENTEVNTKENAEPDERPSKAPKVAKAAQEEEATEGGQAAKMNVCLLVEHSICSYFSVSEK